jgi:hypothetical protein
MSARKRELYSSPNGDKWFLSVTPDTGIVFIRHEANVPSGGHVTEMDIGTFLSGGPRNPEHQALLHLIGTLVEGNPQVAREIPARRRVMVWLARPPGAHTRRTREAQAGRCGPRRQTPPDEHLRLAGRQGAAPGRRRINTAAALHARLA